MVIEEKDLMIKIVIITRKDMGLNPETVAIVIEILDATDTLEITAIIMMTTLKEEKEKHIQTEVEARALNKTLGIIEITRNQILRLTITRRTIDQDQRAIKT